MLVNLLLGSNTSFGQRKHHSVISILSRVARLLPNGRSARLLGPSPWSPSLRWEASKQGVVPTPPPTHRAPGGPTATEPAAFSPDPRALLMRACVRSLESVAPCITIVCQCYQKETFDPFLSLHSAGVEGVGHNPRKGRDLILKRSIAEP